MPNPKAKVILEATRVGTGAFRSFQAINQSHLRLRQKRNSLMAGR